jgi:hypothetical protein
MPAQWPSARSLLITILGDVVHARKVDWNPAERRRGRRGRVRVPGRNASNTAQQTANVITRLRPCAWLNDAHCCLDRMPISS